MSANHRRGVAQAYTVYETQAFLVTKLISELESNKINVCNVNASQLACKQGIEFV